MTPSAPLFYWIFNNQLWFFSYEKHEKLENSLNYICVTTKNCNSDVDVSYHVKYHSDSVADLFCRVTFYTSRWRKSVLGHEWRSHSLNDQICDLEAHWYIINILRTKYLDVSVTLPLAVWNVFWLEKTLQQPPANENTGQGKCLAEESWFYVFFCSTSHTCFVNLKLY